ncbi:MAG: hypothetical protein FWG98_00090 [Candidatus Cloacimonetes bacterium]|nr:hypothetical protein [Candidatus Cloacimonadota bacterium]
MSKLICVKMEMRDTVLHGKTVSGMTCLWLARDPEHEVGALWCSKYNVKWLEGYAHRCIEGRECTYTREKSY